MSVIKTKFINVVEPPFCFDDKKKQFLHSAWRCRTSHFWSSSKVLAQRDRLSMKASRELALLVVFASNECEARPKVLAHPGLVAGGFVNFVRKPGGTSVAVFFNIVLTWGEGLKPMFKRYCKFLKAFCLFLSHQMFSRFQKKFAT